MSNIISFDGGHVLGKCKPVMDDDTHWLLLALMTRMVEHRDRTGDPEAAELVNQIGAIIQRHEPKR